MELWQILLCVFSIFCFSVNCIIIGKISIKKDKREIEMTKRKQQALAILYKYAMQYLQETDKDKDFELVETIRKAKQVLQGEQK